VTAKGGGRPAAFLDRDGTIIRDTVYIRDPKDVELLPGAADAIKRLNERSVVVIVVTNQSGIGRGLLSPEEYEGVRARIDAELAEQGARIDATYMCPHHPEAAGGCDCRKPGLGMYRRAIGDYGLDPRRSLFVGDRWRDVAPSVTLGDQWIEFLTNTGSPDELKNFTLSFTDTSGTAQTVTLSPANLISSAGSPYVLLAAPGSIGRNSVVQLRDTTNTVVDEVDLSAVHAAVGFATGVANEAVARTPDGFDTGAASDFKRKPASIRKLNP